MAKKCEIYMWNHHLGSLVEINGKYIFKMNTNLPFAPSPIALTKNTNMYDFSSLHFQEGIPGLFADSLPDKYGNKYLEQYFKKHKLNLQPNTIDKLLFIGQSQIGALRYEPSEKIKEDQELVLSIRDLHKNSKDALLPDYIPQYELAKFLRNSSSIGGARAKILAYWDKENKVFHLSEIDDKTQDLTPVIIKFDELEEKFQSRYIKIEYIYYQLALKAGLQMRPIHLTAEKDSNKKHLIIERFDRSGAERLHLHSLAGLLHLNYADRSSYDYDLLFRTAKLLFCKQEDLEKIFRQMVFNVVFSNKDDHLKNFSFLMNSQGQWQISPPYDITYNHNQIGQYKYHQLRVNGKNKDFNINDLEIYAKKYNIKDWKDIIYQVESILPMLPQLLLSHELNDGIYDEDILSSITTFLTNKENLLKTIHTTTQPQQQINSLVNNQGLNSIDL